MLATIQSYVTVAKVNFHVSEHCIFNLNFRMASKIRTGINPFIQGPIATNTNVNVSCIQSSIHVEEDTVTSNPILSIRVLRILGCIQIAVGAMCILISCIGIVLDAVDMTRNCNPRSYVQRLFWTSRFNGMGMLDVEKIYRFTVGF